jgi:hypothetical protein
MWFLPEKQINEVWELSKRFALLENGEQWI